LLDLELQPSDTKQKSTNQEKQSTGLIQQLTQVVVARPSRKSNHSRLEICCDFAKRQGSSEEKRFGMETV